MSEKIIESKAPRELAIEAKYHEFYNDLKKGKYLPELKSYEMAYLFVLAMSYGVYYDNRKKIHTPKRSISKNFVENEWAWLVRAVAIAASERGVEILPDEAEVYKIAEEYANGGIEIIKEILSKSKPLEFEITMEKELSKIYGSKV